MTEVCICVSERGNPSCPRHGADVRQQEAEREQRRFLRSRGWRETVRGWDAPQQPLGPFHTLQVAYEIESNRVRHWTSLKTRQAPPIRSEE